MCRTFAVLNAAVCEAHLKKFIGEISSRPPPSSRVSNVSSNTRDAPRVEPITHAVRSDGSSLSPLSRSAASPARAASCATRPMLRRSVLESRSIPDGVSGNGAAGTGTGQVFIIRTALLPAARFSNSSAGVLPRADTTPAPVMTILFPVLFIFRTPGGR